MNDAKYLAWLGVSLTAFMASALFLLVLLNPKDASYSFMPLAYAIGCFLIGIATNLLARSAEQITRRAAMRARRPCPDDYSS
ncbi:hypothetical protein [Stieleria mannarensis]|uniref:hypothetical protein n=1 Tax=Stieleria mannarensis TaxID=2755585 RepID=UPI001603EF01|nr:hypothetical protein [Rhodopirellula sp. JC639]